MGYKAKELARIIFRHLPINWRIVIKRWVGRDLSLVERLSLLDIPIAENGADSTQVLFWRGIPGRASIYSEVIIALALRMRGISTRFIICDGVLSGCIQRSIENDKPISEWRKRCHQCVRYGIRILEDYGIPYVVMSKFVSRDKQAEIRKICSELSSGDLDNCEYCTVPVGQIAITSAGRYLRGQSLEGHEAILREYLFSSLVCSEAAMVALGDLKPSRVFMQAHIEYEGWAPAYVVLTRAGLPTTLWGGDIGQDRCITLRNVAGMDWRSIYSLSDEVWEERSKKPLTSEEVKALMAAIV
ncbi:MAG: hypothetical protein ISS28_02045, partial [Candidatus Cloacimonetes bacterium]|nr:hypothetical protein [Candidatus Cloacimonadota bacterium]